MSISPQELTEQLNGSWSSYVLPELRDFVSISLGLYEREYDEESELTDYSFIVFPMAKAYEGFLKQYFLDLGLISESTYFSRRFRIGRALNPDVQENQRDKWWLYDDVARQCGAGTAQTMWTTWLESRNRIFHFFPKKHQRVTLAQAGQHLATIAESMRQAITCQAGELGVSA